LPTATAQASIELVVFPVPGSDKLGHEKTVRATHVDSSPAKLISKSVVSHCASILQKAVARSVHCGGSGAPVPLEPPSFELPPEPLPLPPPEEEPPDEPPVCAPDGEELLEHAGTAGAARTARKTATYRFLILFCLGLSTWKEIRPDAHASPGGSPGRSSPRIRIS